MLSIFENPLSLDEGMVVRWDAFEREFLSLYESLYLENADTQPVAISLIELCRAAIGGFVDNEDFTSVERVIDYYSSRTSEIVRAGGFRDVTEFSIIHYESMQEKERLQRNVLPKIVGPPMSEDGEAEPDLVAVPHDSTACAELDDHSTSPSRLNRQWWVLLEVVCRLPEMVLLPFLTADRDYATGSGITIRELFGNLGEQPSDLASRINRELAHRRMSHHAATQERGSRREDANTAR